MPYSTAIARLTTINEQIENKEFDAGAWSKQSLNDKRFDLLWDSFVNQKIKAGRSPAMQKLYRVYRTHFEPLEALDVRLIRLKHLQGLYEKLEGSDKYRKNIMECLHTFFRWLVRWGEIEKCPIWPEYAACVKPEGFALMYEDQQEILKRIPVEHRDIIEFAMETGLRPGEACALQVQDIDFKRRMMLVRRTWSMGKLRTTKEKKESWRALSDRACTFIEKNIDQPRVATLSKDSYASCFIFVNTDAHKRPYRPEFLCRLWRKYSGVAMRLYDGTRHSWVSQMIEAGAQPMELGIHTNERTTRTYFHASTSRQHELANKRGKVVDIRRELGKS